MKAILPDKSLSIPRVEEIADQFDMQDIILPFLRERKKMPMHRIVRLEGEGNYTIFHFADGSQLMVSLTLKKIESRLSPRVFARPHKKNIINLLYLQSVLPNRQQMSAVLTNGDRVDVSRRKASRFIKQVNGFRQELNALKGTKTAPIIIVS